jgi:2-keto-4-pentenoate hydratase
MQTQLARWRATLAGGATRVGWKTGINAPVVQRALGIDDVVLGHLTSATTLPAGATHPLAGGTRVGMEAEVALHIGADLPGGASPEQARAAVARRGAAIELVDNDRPFDDVEAIVANNVFHRAVSFGTASPPPRGPWLNDVTARIMHNGAQIEAIDTAAVAGDLIAIVRFVADTLAACGEQLRTGDRIIAGSLGRLFFVEPGDVVVADLGRLGNVTLHLCA